MELKQLEAFVQVAELGSFTRAAITLDTNQPALSRLVRQLEVELRHTLLERNGRGGQHSLGLVDYGLEVSSLVTNRKLLTIKGQSLSKMSYISTMTTFRAE